MNKNQSISEEYSLHQLGKNLPSRNIVVSGTTGFLGGHFLLFRSRSPGKFFPLIRNSDLNVAKARLESKLNEYASSYNFSFEGIDKRGNIFPTYGDLSLESLGMTESQISFLKSQNIDELWHFAANLHFEPRFEEEIFRDNVGGTNKMLELARQIGAKKFIYVSTAYSVGDKTGEIEEALIDESEVNFHNLYEKSKCRSENIVAQFCNEHKIDFSILRPSIIVGPRATFKTGGSDSGLYGFVGSVFRVKELIKKTGKPLSVIGDGKNGLNCVPVDEMNRDIMYLIKNNFPGGPVYNLTGSIQPEIDGCMTHLSKHLDIAGIEMTLNPSQTRSPLEKLVDRGTSFYANYLKNRKTFKRSIPFRTGITLDDMNSYLRVFIRELNNPKESSLFRRETISSGDSLLNVFSATKGRSGIPVVFVNAYGMPIEIVNPLASMLSDHFDLHSWESRWLPSMNEDFDPSQCDLQVQLNDMEKVFDHFNIAKAHVIGWCTGSQVALEFSEKFQNRIQSLTLLNGSYSVPSSVKQTEFHNNLVNLLTLASQDKKRAEMYCKVIYGTHVHTYEKDEKRDSKQIGQLLSHVDPFILHLTSAPFRSGEALFRFAHMLLSHFRWPVRVNSSTQIPKLVVTGLQDGMTHSETSKYVSKILHNADYLEMTKGDHFSIFYDQNLFQVILNFLNNQNKSQKERKVG